MPSIPDAGLVALRKESVDRNQASDISTRREAKSLSARRAWIEIRSCLLNLQRLSVALRKESVDRNQRIAKPFREQFKVALRKESVDRNREQFKYVVQCRVALRKESVDRNMLFLSFRLTVGCRSPQGERG